MYFCIRDDDTSYFTSPEELERAYGEISRIGPVSLAIIPFCRAGGSQGVPVPYRKRWSTHPLHENAPLVSYLRDRIREGRFEVMLHGYHHDEPHGNPEFSHGGDLRRRVAEGRRYLESVLDTKVRMFVPPHNAIGRQGLQAIAAEGLDLGGAAGMRAGWSRLAPQSWRTWWELREWRWRGGVGVPWVLDLGTHRECPGTAITPRADWAQVEAALECALAEGAMFCAATHYWELETPNLRNGGRNVGEHLQWLIDRAMADPRVVWRSVGATVCEEQAILNPRFI